MNLLRSLLLASVVALPAVARSQVVTLKADSAALLPSGGQVVLTATADYSGQPGALAWSITLPRGWTLTKVSGPNLPGIAPETGATGVLEFAYTAVPANRAEFAVTARYDSGVPEATVTGTVLVRDRGTLKTVAAAPVILAAQK